MPKRYWVKPIDPEYARVLEAQAEALSPRVSAEEAARLEKPCTLPLTYLYLVSAEKKGIQYWKVGITEKKNPIDRAPKFYREVFRQEQFVWKTHAQDVETSIARFYRSLNKVAERDGYEIVKPPTKEGLAYTYSLDVALEVFDWWVDLARTSERIKYPYYGDKEDKPNYIFNRSSFGDDARLDWLNYSKYAFADSFLGNFETWHRRRKNGLRHSMECYLYYNDYYLEGTEDCPYPKKFDNLMHKVPRCKIHYLFQLTDWLDPHAMRLTKFRPEREQLAPEAKEPEWE